MNFAGDCVHASSLMRHLPVQPFLKWAGGKRWLFRRYRHLFPSEIRKLIDPFFGGGSSFFLLRPESALLSDLNADLIELYQAVRNNPKHVTSLLLKHHRLHCKAYYYAARSKKPSDNIEKAAWFLYLNRTCWNGLFRVNLRGEFNVPIGTKTKVFVSHDELDLHSKLLRNAGLSAGDFETAIGTARKGDLVFADPPYFEKQTNIRFLKYNSNVFCWDDQIRLRDSLIRAAQRGAACFVTNSNHRSLVKLYKNDGIMHKLTRHSVVAGSASGRRPDTEIMVELR